MDGTPFDKEFLDTFNVEAKEKISNLSEGLLKLESDELGEEGIKRLFREAHTLKGSAGMMGFGSIKILAHRIEDILTEVQKGNLKLESDAIDLLLATLDKIESMLPAQEVPADESDVPDLLERLNAVSQSSLPKVDGNESRDDLCNVSEKEGKKPFNKAAEASEKKEAMPEPAHAHQDSSEKRDCKPSDTTIRVNIERLDKLMNLMGEIIISQIGTESKVNELGKIKGRTEELKGLFDAIVQHMDQIRTQIPSDAVDSLTQKINKAGSTAAAVAEALDHTAAGLKESTATHQLALKELHDSTLNVRMLPLETIFNTYPRVVRDTANACGKKVKLEVKGEKTELDKRILEQISDPLMHIIRNCVDHGIEAGEDRATAGKPDIGLVSLKAEHRGDMVDIIIEDDGAGIDPDKIRVVAKNRGVIGNDDELSDAEALGMLFKPGFSTTEKVTEISGRGIGLDVVKNNIEKLDGTVHITSVPGEGSKITVTLPVTLVVINGLLVEAGNSRFVVPVSSILEMVSVPIDEIRSIGEHEGFLMRNNAVPLVDLLEMLGGGSCEGGKEKTSVIIAGNKQQCLGLKVDSLLGEHEVLIKPLDPFLGHHPFITGVSILSDGEVVIVLNTLEIVRAAGHGIEVAMHNDENNKLHARERIKVLVVEDSLVVRELQRNILEAAGYEVDTAVDGQDALIHLDAEAIDCVVTDIEMPVMNGFDLTSAIRGNEEYRQMPVIMVSSRNSDDDKRRGIDAGADAYVVKDSFDQKNLLNTIERLVA